ncbi:MAG: pyridoxal phosphate-dependent aminotransferase [Spirochaetaceae bacterium]|nr:pyridoxal phosphate-dependent aminotransferase [Spirochaetaceae bacterium]
MKYDFTTQPERGIWNSSKWKQMRDLNPAVPAGIVPLSVADMEFPMPPEMREALLAFTDGLVMRYPVPTEAYFAAFAGWCERRHHWKIQKDWIIPMDGVIPGFYAAIQALTERGDGVIIMPPVYPPFFTAVKAAGCGIEENTLVIRNGRYEIDFEDLEKKARAPKTKALLFCSPHNPVGRVWETEELRRVGAICAENNVTVISDEIHADLILPGHTHRVFPTVDGAFAGMSIVLTAPSKTFNIAGIHCANAVIQNEGLRNKFNRILSVKNAYHSLNLYAYAACEAAYSRCEPWLEELLLVIDGNRKLAEDFLSAEIPQIKVFPLEGTYLQWWDCRGLGMDSGELSRFLTQEALLFLDDGPIFGESGRGFERINLACPASTLQAALERLKGALRKRGLGRA